MTHRRPSTKASRRSSAASMRGMMLLEVLIATLLFVLGILGMVGISTLGVTTQSEARNRTDAATLTNELAQRIWLNVDRGSETALQASLAAFRYQETETTPCRFDGNTTAGNATLTDWIANSFGGQGSHVLPGTESDMFSIAVGTGVTDFNRVTITVCWQTSTDPVPRRHVLETWVN